MYLSQGCWTMIIFRSFTFKHKSLHICLYTPEIQSKFYRKSKPSKYSAYPKCRYRGMISIINNMSTKFDNFIQKLLSLGIHKPKNGLSKSIVKKYVSVLCWVHSSMHVQISVVKLLYLFVFFVYPLYMYVLSLTYDLLHVLELSVTYLVLAKGIWYKK